MTLFSLPNLQAQQVCRYDAPPVLVRPAFPSKAAYRAWCNHEDTQHAFVSTFEGVNPGQRISQTNPPVKLHGLIAEYDAAFHPDLSGMFFRGPVKN